jgi:membrane fusion protein, multidrug efflux system
MARIIETKVLDAEEGVELKQRGTKEHTSPTHPKRWFVFAILLIGVAAAALWWRHSLQYESTDDAQVDGHIDLVSARVSGTVTYVNPRAENNQFVKAGTLLAELDRRDYEAALEQARANLNTRTADANSARITIPIVNASAYGQLHAAEAARSEALANVQSEEANLLAAQHKLQQDEAILTRTERDRTRYQALVEKHEISRSDFDARDTEATTAAQSVAADRALVLATEQRISQVQSLVKQREAQIEVAHAAPQQVTDAHARADSASGHLAEARADFHTAQLNLSYTRIYAPVSGVIGRKTIELGHRIQPGQSLLAIVPIDDLWITANFKETQLRHMRPGQPVSIRIDTFGRDYQGEVESLPGAAGPVFSLFPPENATGNYVKVVQRFPVRIRLKADQDPEHTLRPGMSVEPTVKVR